MVTSNKGFTLIELIVVIAIITILVGMAIVAIDPVRVIQESRDTRNRTEMNQIKTALQMYYNDNRRYPTAGAGGEFYSPSCAGVCFTPTYMRELPSVIDATEFEYAVSGSGDNYDAKVRIERPTNDDTDSVDKCGSDTLLVAAPTDHHFMVCPD